MLVILESRIEVQPSHRFRLSQFNLQGKPTIRFVILKAGTSTDGHGL